MGKNKTTQARRVTTAYPNTLTVLMSAALSIMLTIRVCWHVFRRVILHSPIWVKTHTELVPLPASAPSSRARKYFEAHHLKIIIWGMASFLAMLLCVCVWNTLLKILLLKIHYGSGSLFCDNWTFKLALRFGQRTLMAPRPMCPKCPWASAKLCSGLGLARRSFQLFSKQL